MTFMFLVKLILIACLLAGMFFIFEMLRLIGQGNENAAKRKKEEAEQIEASRIRSENEAIEREQRIKASKIQFNEKLDSIPDADPEPLALEPNDIKYKIVNITNSTTISKLCDYVVVDLETTGLSPTSCEIIEIGAIRYANFEPVEKLDILIKPKKSLPTKITELTGITKEMLSDATDIETAIHKLQAFVKDSIIIAHNAEFDMDFLEANNFVFSKNQRVYDTLKLAQRTLKRFNESLTSGDIVDHQLTTLCSYYEIYRDNAHRAVSDCMATSMVYTNLLHNYMGINI